MWEILAAAGGLLGLHPLLKKLADFVRQQRTMRRVAERLRPALEALVAEMEALGAAGEELIDLLDCIPERSLPVVPIAITNELCLTWSRAVDRIVGVLDGVRQLAELAGSITIFETTMEPLRLANPGAYELLKLLERSYEGDGLNLKEFPSFLTLYGPKRGIARKLRREAEEAVDQASPIVERAMAIRLSGPFNRHTKQTIAKSLVKLKAAGSLLRGHDEGTAEEMMELSPEWMRPFAELTDKLE